MFDNGIISVLFESRLMDLDLANHVSLVSRQFLSHARSFQLKLKHVDMKLVCHNVIFQHRVLSWLSSHSPNLQSIRNVKVMDDRLFKKPVTVCAETLTSMQHLTNVHFACFEMNLANLICLFDLPKLDILSIEKLTIADNFDVDRFDNRKDLPKLQLSQLKVDRFLKFASVCNAENLMSLSTSFKISRGESVQGFCNRLKRCTSLQTLKIDKVKLDDGNIGTRLLMQQINALPNLVNLSIKGVHTDWATTTGIKQERLLQSLTELDANRQGFQSCASLVELQKFRNLRHLQFDVLEFRPRRAFEMLPGLQSMVYTTWKWYGRRLTFGDYTMQLIVLSKLSRCGFRGSNFFNLLISL